LPLMAAPGRQRISLCIRLLEISDDLGAAG
jgi:hypothetical protein